MRSPLASVEILGGLQAIIGNVLIEMKADALIDEKKSDKIREVSPGGEEGQEEKGDQVTQLGEKEDRMEGNVNQVRIRGVELIQTTRGPRVQRKKNVWEVQKVPQEKPNVRKEELPWRASVRKRLLGHLRNRRSDVRDFQSRRMKVCHFASD